MNREELIDFARLGVGQSGWKRKARPSQPLG
jgi:hypothetical protein